MYVGFPCGPAARIHLIYSRLAGDTGLIPGSGRSPGVGHGNPLQYSCLGIHQIVNLNYKTVHYKSIEVICSLNCC